MNGKEHQQRTDTNPNADDESAGIDAALSQLEGCLESPVVPGELPSWASAVEEAYKDVRDPLRHELEHTHPDHFDQISSENSDLLHQVEQMHEEDALIREHYGKLADKIEQFRKRVEPAEPHESKLDECLSAVVDEGLQFVIRVRSQQQAVSTWLLESFQRDTGVAD